MDVLRADVAEPVLVLKVFGEPAGAAQLPPRRTPGGAFGRSPCCIFRAACEQTGVIEIGNVQALFNGALALSYQPLPAGNR